jgi:hypothetical protein
MKASASVEASFPSILKVSNVQASALALGWAPVASQLQPIK